MRKRRARAAGLAGERDFDPARRVVGRKRHALTNTDGRRLVAGVTTADLHSSYGGIVLLRASRWFFPFLNRCFADRAYKGERVGTTTAITVEIAGLEAGEKGFAVQSMRWAIEQILSWIGR